MLKARNQTWALVTGALLTVGFGTGCTSSETAATATSPHPTGYVSAAGQAQTAANPDPADPALFGAFDERFARGGFLSQDRLLGHEGSDRASSAAQQSDGQLIVAGVAQNELG